MQILLCAAVVKDVPVVLGGGVGPGQWGIIASTLVLVCGIESRCLVWLVVSLLAAHVSHVLPFDAVVLLGFR